jgi:hypothetical protein
MIRSLLMVLFLSVIVVGCSRDPYRKYLGLWERVDKPGHVVLEIKRDGETVLLNHNALAELHDLLGHPKAPSVLAQNNGQLAIATGFGGAPLGLSGDEDFLLVMDERYKRVEPKRLDEIREEIAAEKKAAAENKARCEKLDTERKKEREAVSGKSWSDQAIAQRQAIESRYQEQAKQIPDCHLWGMW